MSSCALCGFQVAEHFVFCSDPKQGVGQLFSAEAVRKACDDLGVDMIIRGHQVAEFYAIINIILLDFAGLKNFEISHGNIATRSVHCKSYILKIFSTLHFLTIST